MKAIKCTTYGPPDVLKIVNIDKPLPGDNDVMVRIVSTTVTVADCRVRGFKVPASFWLPAKLALGFFRPRQPILGGEISGIIEQVGKNVKKFKAGDEIFAFLGSRFGGYTEYICIDENECIALKPEKLSFEQSAALPLGSLTALHFLKKGKVEHGKNVLIYGASGSVGTYAVQLAKYFGAEVTGVCSTANMELVRKLGADRIIDYTKNDLGELDDKFDVVFDTVGKGDISKIIKIIKPDGIYLHAVATPFTEIKIRLDLILTTKKIVGGSFKATVEQIDFIRKLANDGAIKPVIDRQYILDDIVIAHEYVDKGHKKGNVVIKVRSSDHVS